MDGLETRFERFIGCRAFRFDGLVVRLFPIGRGMDQYTINSYSFDSNIRIKESVRRRLLVVLASFCGLDIESSLLLLLLLIIEDFFLV